MDAEIFLGLGGQFASSVIGSSGYQAPNQLGNRYPLPR